MKKRIAAVCIFASLLGQAGTGFALPDDDYACQVQTNSGQAGLVMVQAYDLSSAIRIAGQVNAMRMDGVAEQAKTVVQCILFPQQRFTDTAFQAFVDALPR